MVFDSTAKDQVRSRIDIVDHIGRYVKLKQSGRNYKGLCPFHKEKSPSFMVSPDRASFHCFGCGKGGDIFTFVQEFEHVEFKDALKMLAEEAGVKLQTPTGSSPDHQEEQPPAGPGKAELLHIHRIAQAFYYRQIKPHPQAVAYFKSRGLKPEIIKEFGLGYAPQGWSNLIDHCRTLEVEPSSVESCGLALRKSAESTPYDRFRDRVMFTLYDIAGRPVGFAGRALEKDAKPKYLNSPETAIYQKSKILYGLHASRKAIAEQDQIIIVEGYMDYLSLYQAGIRNAAATSGTALTAEHGQIIKRFTQHVALVFDGDSAGISAAQRAIFSLAPYNLDVRVLILPDNEDPDSYVGKYGPEAFLALLKESREGLLFLLARLKAQIGIDTPQGVSQILDQTLPYLTALTDEIVIRHSIARVAQELGIDIPLVNQRMGRKRPARHQEPATKPQPVFNTAAFASTLEGNFLRILLSTPSLIPQAQEYVGTESFTNPMSKNIYSIITMAYARNQGLEGLLDSITDPALKGVVAGLLMQEGPVDQAQDDLTHSIMALQRQFLKSQQRQYTERLRRLADHDKEQKVQLLEKYKEITVQLNELKNG